MLIKPRRNEQPNLVQDPGHSDHEAEINAEVYDQADVSGWIGVIELVVKMVGAQRLLHRLDDEVDEVFRDHEAEDHSDADRSHGADQAFAQLDKVVEKRHRRAGFFGGHFAGGALRRSGGHHRSLVRIFFRTGKARTCSVRSGAVILARTQCPSDTDRAQYPWISCLAISCPDRQAIPERAARWCLRLRRHWANSTELSPGTKARAEFRRQLAPVAESEAC